MKGENDGKESLTAEMELRSHFSGKRSGERRPQKLKITICGVMDNYPALSIDISKSGVLLEITDDVFRQDEDSLAAFAFKVQTHFQHGADILFAEHGFGVTASVVRVTHKRGALLLACRFRHRLSEGQCEALEIES